MDFVESLIKRMVQEDPAKRPSMDQATAEFDKLAKALSKSRLSSRLVSRQEFFVETFVRDASHTVRGLFVRSSSSR
jgi:hypothetical protein